MEINAFIQDLRAAEVVVPTLSPFSSSLALPETGWI